MKYFRAKNVTKFYITSGNKLVSEISCYVRSGTVCASLLQCASGNQVSAKLRLKWSS